MNLARFLAQRQPEWQKLQAIVDRLDRRDRTLEDHQVNQMVHLYRQVSADLAQLRVAQADPALVARINRLVTRAHGQVYRSLPAPATRRSSLFRFLLVDHPRLFRRLWPFTAASFLICLIVTLMAYVSVQQRPDVVADIMGGRMDAELYGTRDPGDIIDRFKQIDAPLLGSMVTVNNIRVALTAAALGVTFGIGTVLILIYNSVMLGGFAGAFARSGIESVFWSTVLPHGALELSVIVVAGGAGLVMGWSLWCPGRRTRLLALRQDAIHAVLLVLGLVPAFIAAGFMEGFITPAEHLPQWSKVTLGVLLALGWWGHVLLSGRQAVEPAAEAGVVGGK